MRILLILAAFICVSCAQKDTDRNVRLVDGFTDPRDNKTYKTVQIGSQIWMAGNLNYNIKNSECYDYDLANCEKYGRLYTWYMAKGACPSGWHLPSNAEWDKLLLFADGINHTRIPYKESYRSPYESETAGKYLKARHGWYEKPWGRDNEGSGGTDKYGFAALPGGGANFNCNGSINSQPYYCSFNREGSFGEWWSSDENHAYYRIMNYANDSVNIKAGYKDDMRSVRCLRELQPWQLWWQRVADSISIVLAEQIAYRREIKSVKIGSQVWMAENLNHAASGSICFDNKPANCDKYGWFYSFERAKTICPKGWHLPSDEEWDKLVNFLGGAKAATAKLKATSGWHDREDRRGVPRNGTDDYGFTALPDGRGMTARWWTSSSKNRGISYGYSELSSSYIRWDMYGLGPTDTYLSVRCVRD